MYNSKVIAVLVIFGLTFVSSFYLKPTSPLQFRLKGEVEESMSVDELKAELDLRGVDFTECISKQNLVDLLVQSRVVGKANPDILKKFNEFDQQLTIDDSTLDGEEVKDMLAKDGALPGGMSLEMIKALTSDKDIVMMLKDKKMQAIMSDIMTQGPEAMKKHLYDPDAIMLIQKLGKAIDRAQKQ